MNYPEIPPRKHYILPPPPRRESGLLPSIIYALAFVAAAYCIGWVMAAFIGWAGE